MKFPCPHVLTIDGKELKFKDSAEFRAYLSEGGLEKLIEGGHASKEYGFKAGEAEVVAEKKTPKTAKEKIEALKAKMKEGAVRLSKKVGIIKTEEEFDQSIVDEMNAIEGGLKNKGVDVSSSKTTSEKIDVEGLNERGTSGKKLVKVNWEDYEGIPFTFTISDQLRSGDVVNPITGEIVRDLKGGLGFNITKGNENAAWANTTPEEAANLQAKALDVYNANKALFQKAWKDGKLPHGQVPVAVVKMGEGSILSNEAVFRVGISNIEKVIPKANRKKAVEVLKKELQRKISEARAAIKRGVKLDKNGNPTKERLSKITLEHYEKAAAQRENILKVVNDGGYTDIVDILKDNSKFALPERTLITKEIFSSKPTKPGASPANINKAEVGTAVSAALIGDLGVKGKEALHLGRITDVITEPAMKSVPSHHIIAIVGIDVLNPGQVKTTHPHYPAGVKGSSIGVLEQPIHVKDAFGEAYGSVLSQVIKAEVKKSTITGESAVSAGLPTQSALGNEVLRGAIAKKNVAAIDKFTGFLRQAFPSTTFFSTPEAWDAAMKDPSVTKKLKDGQVIYGFTKDGRIWLNPELKSNKVALHEVGHIWGDYTKANNKPLWDKGLSLVDGTKEHEAAKKEYGDTELAREEAVMELMSSMGETITNSAQKSAFKEWILGVWAYVSKNFKSLQGLSPKQVSKVTLDQFLKGMLADVTKGAELKGGPKEVKGKEVRLSAAEHEHMNDIRDIVKELHEQGFSKDEIKKVVENDLGDVIKGADKLAGRAYDEIAPEMVGKELPAKTQINKPTGVLKEKVVTTVDEKSALKDQLKLEIKAAKEGFREGVKVSEEKALVKKEADIRDKEKKGLITIKESVALREKLKSAARGAREAFSFAKKEASSFSELIIDVIDKKFKGKLSPAQVEAITRRALRVKSANGVHKFYEYAKKVIDNVNYKKEIDDAYSVKSSIKSRNSNKAIPANNKAAVREFLSLDPESVSSLNEYRVIARDIKENQSKLTIGEEGIEGGDYAMSNDKIIEYVEKQREFSELIQKERLKEDYQDMIDAGVINPEAMSLKEMKDIIEAAEYNENLDAELSKIKDSELKEKTAVVKEYVDSKIEGLEKPIVDLGEREKGVFNSVKEIDTSTLGIKDLLKINDVINNIETNGDFTGSGIIETISNGQKGFAEIDKARQRSGVKNLGDISKFFVESFSGKAMLFEFLAKHSKLAAEIQRHLGISKIYDEHTKVKSEQGKLVDGLIDLKDGVKNIETPENRVMRGIYAHLLQDFQGYKEKIETSIDRLKNSKEESEQKLGVIYSDAYEKVAKGAVDINEVRERLEKANKVNSKIVDYVVNAYKGKEAATSESARIDNNREWVSEDNYSPTKVVSLFGKESGAEGEAFAKEYFPKKVKAKEAGTKIARKRDLQRHQVLDLDFDKVATQKFYETNYDVATTASINKVAWMLAQDRAVDMLGGVRNIKTISKFLKSAIDRQRGTTPPADRVAKAAERLTKVIQAKSVRIALKGVSQFLKQYTSIIPKTLGTLGSDAPLFVKALTVSNSIPLFEEYNVSGRGESEAGFNKDQVIKQIEAMQLGDRVKDFQNNVSKVSEIIDKVISKPLILSDKSIARTSWLAYYMSALKSQGVDISTIDWNLAHLSKNDEAAAYAEQMTSRAQGESNPTAQPLIYASDQYGAMVRNVAMPFNSFSLNMRMSLTSDLQKIFYGGDKRSAGKSIASTLLEQAVFNAMKVYLISAAAQAVGNVVLNAFGMYDEDAEKEKERITSAGRLKKVVGNSTSDFLFGGLGVLQKGIFEPSVNKAAKALGASEDVFHTYDPSKYGEPDFSLAGTYGAALSTGYNLYKGTSAMLGEIEETTKGGIVGSKTKGPEYAPVKLTEDEHRLAMLIWAIDAAALVGVSDADVLQINNKIRTGFKKRRQEEYEGSQFKIQTKPKVEIAP